MGFPLKRDTIQQYFFFEFFILKKKWIRNDEFTSLYHVSVAYLYGFSSSHRYRATSFSFSQIPATASIQTDLYQPTSGYNLDNHYCNGYNDDNVRQISKRDSSLPQTQRLFDRRAHHTYLWRGHGGTRCFVKANRVVKVTIQNFLQLFKIYLNFDLFVFEFCY